MARGGIEFVGRHPASSSGAVGLIPSGGLTDCLFRASWLSIALSQNGR